MRALQLVMIAALSIAVPIAAEAQYTTGQQPTTTATATTTTPSPENQWIASGFAGGNFANNADPSSPAFGGSIGYLWNGKWGAEFDAGFTPDFGLQSNFFGLGIKPMVNTYMANAVAAMPFGLDRGGSHSSREVSGRSRCVRVSMPLMSVPRSTRRSVLTPRALAVTSAVA